MLSDAEEVLAFQLRVAGIDYEREYRAVPERRYRWDGYVYLLRKAQYDNKTDAYIHADYPRVGLLNQSWWCVRQPEDEDIREFVLSLFPGWVDKDLARRVLEIKAIRNNVWNSARRIVIHQDQKTD